MLFIVAAAGDFRYLHSFPTRRSSDLELARRNIPFVKYGGLKFLEASHVKDLLAVLRFAENPRGRMAGFRVTQLIPGRSDEHTSELQSQSNLVCRLLLEKKKRQVKSY